MAGSFSMMRANHYVDVGHVIDGDTFTTSEGETIRLLGINTPEIAHDKKPGQPLGKEATQALEKMITGQRVRLAFDQDRQDQYGRTLAQVWLPDNSWVNGQLIEMGLAHVYTFTPNTRWTQELLQLELEARASERGIWNNARFKVLNASRVTDLQVGQFRLIQGEVKSLDKNGWGFDLGKVHISIPKKARKLFGNRLTFKIHDRLTIRGKLRISRKGRYFMPVYLPQDIEVNP